MTNVPTHRRAADTGRRTPSPQPRPQAVNPPPDPAFDAYVKDRIDFRVRKLALGFALSEDDQDDYRADMTAEVCSAMRRFDPRKAKRETFVSRVLDRFVMYAMRSRCNQMKRPCANPLGFSDISEAFEPVSNDECTGELNEANRIELRLDVELVVARMSDRLQGVARLLMHLSPADTAREMGIHPCSIYRLMDQIRAHFLNVGMNPSNVPREDSTVAADVEGAPKGTQR